MPSAPAAHTAANSHAHTSDSDCNSVSPENLALIAGKKDPEANHSASDRERKWPLLTSVCKVIGCNSTQDVLLSQQGIKWP